MKEQIKPLYSELQGYLSQAPPIKETYDAISEPDYWTQINSTIDELNQLTGKDYSKFKLEPENRSGSHLLRITIIRLKLGGIISRLHGEYFSNEPAPFSGMPNTVNNFTQTQQQTATQTIILEFNDILNEKIASTPNETEKSFLQKIKNGLGAIKSTAELINLILTTANQFGFDVTQIANIFS